MNTFNGVALTMLVLLFIVVAVVTVSAIRSLELCEDKMQGLIKTSSSMRQLRAQSKKAGRTAGAGFLLVILIGMIIAGTLEFPY